MADEQKPPDDTPEDISDNPILDRRQKFWTGLPNYVVTQYARWIGSTAVLVYLALCYYARAKDACWPAARTVGNLLGLSKGTIWRQLGCLAHYGLIQIENRTEQGRKTTNRYTLLDPDKPPEECPPYLNHGGRGRAGAPTDSAPARPTDSAPARPTDSAPARPTDSAPARLQEVDPEEKETKEVCVSPYPHGGGEVQQGEVKHLTALWLNQLNGGTPKFVSDQKAEIRREVEVLLRRGIPLEVLETAILCPDRTQNEWPRQFAARFSEKNPKTRTNQQRAQATAELRAREQRERDEAGRSARTARELVKQLAKKMSAEGVAATIGVAADLPPVPPKG